MPTPIEYIAAHVERLGLLKKLGQNHRNDVVRDAIAMAFFQRTYDEVVAAEKSGIVKKYPKPPPYVDQACQRFKIDKNALLMAMESAFADLRFEVAIGDAEPDTIGTEPLSENKVRTFLLRVRRDLIKKGEMDDAALLILCASSVQDLFWMVDEFDDPTAFEYRLLAPGEGVCLSYQGVDSEGADSDEVVGNESYEITGELRNALNAGIGKWHCLAEALESAYSKGIIDL